jgi:hypothetical protein
MGGHLVVQRKEWQGALGAIFAGRLDTVGRRKGGSECGVGHKM